LNPEPWTDSCGPNYKNIYNCNLQVCAK